MNRDGTGNGPLYFATDPAKWITPLKEWVAHESFIQDTGDMAMVMEKIGLMVVKPDGSALIASEDSFWHCATTRDGKWIGADDRQGRIWLAKARTGDVRLLASGVMDKIPSVHPHLSFDHSGRWLVFYTGRSHESVALIDLQQIR